MRPIEKLKPQPPTPAEELCQCKDNGPILLRSALTPFPLYCMECNGEIALEQLEIDDDLAEEIARWSSVHDALYRLWLDSGDYEKWAKERLMDLKGQVNYEGMKITKELNKQRETYYWVFRDSDDDKYVMSTECPICRNQLVLYGSKGNRVCDKCHLLM
jgi:predicted  nucleic acid-binding Zn ribbon protein